MSVRSFCRRYGYARSTFYWRLGRDAAFLNAERAGAVARLHPPRAESDLEDWTTNRLRSAPIADDLPAPMCGRARAWARQSRSEKAHSIYIVWREGSSARRNYYGLRTRTS